MQRKMYAFVYSLSSNVYELQCLHTASMLALLMYLAHETNLRHTSKMS